MKPQPTPSFAAVLLALVCISAAPAWAHAHTGAGLTSGVAAGVAHPLTGLDHLLAMTAVGLWAVQRGGRATWVLPATFVAVMGAGGWLGAAHVSLPWVEPAIVASVLMLGTLVAATAHLPLAASIALIGACALAHGHAHGTELPATAAGLGYGLGFMASSAGLILTGIGLARLCQRAGAAAAVRIAGGGVAACGLYLCLA